MRNVSEKNRTKNQNKHFVSKSFFFFENRALYGIKWKNTTEQVSPQITIPRIHTLFAGCLRLQTHTLGICNTYCNIG